MPRPHFTPRKDPVPIVQEDGCAPDPVWTDGKSRPHRDSIPDRPARRKSLYRLSYRAHSKSALRGENALQDPGKIFFFVSIRSAYVTTTHFHQTNGVEFLLQGSSTFNVIGEQAPHSLIHPLPNYVGHDFINYV